MSVRSPATFNHPDWLRAVLAHAPGLVEAKVPAAGFARISAAWRKHNLPIPYFETMVTALAPAGLPSATTAPTPDDIYALLDGAEAPILFRNMPLAHPTTKVMFETAPHSHVLHHWQRAGLILNGSFDEWMQNNFDQKRRKELKRLRTRLSEQGQLDSVSLQPGQDFDSFLQAFLRLERAGWKGTRGTAIASDAHGAQAIHDGLKAMHEKGRLRFWQINFDGKAIASLFALVDDGEATLGKIAYDENFAKYSPGVLIILDATASLFAEPDLELADSNAIPDHPMINRIWRDRIACADVLLAGTATTTTTFKTLSLFLGMKRAARKAAKRVLIFVTGRKVS
jgi:Acetyltransferase (GNAT) domain